MSSVTPAPSHEDLAEQSATLTSKCAELAAEVTRLRTIIDAIPEALMVVDRDGTLLDANRGALAMVGVNSLEQIAGLSIYALADANLREQSRRFHESVFAGATPQMEFEATDPLGARRWVASQAVPLCDVEGAIVASLSLTQEITARKELEQRLRQVEVMVENAPDGFSLTELDGRIVYLNPAFRTMLGYPTTPVGAPLLQFFAEHEHGRVPQLMQVVLSKGGWQGTISYRRTDGSTFDAQLTAFVVRDATGAPVGLSGIARDLTEEQQRERERAELQEQVIQAQQAALRELSTPLIPLAKGVVAMPLIGSIDSGRAQQVLETLLEGVAASRATTAIIDITGVPVVDTQVANALLRAAHATKLLGAQVVLTGIRPEVAQTLVGLGADLGGIVTRATLQSGIAFGMGQG